MQGQGCDITFAPAQLQEGSEGLEHTYAETGAISANSYEVLGFETANPYDRPSSAQDAYYSQV